MAVIPPKNLIADLHQGQAVSRRNALRALGAIGLSAPLAWPLLDGIFELGGEGRAHAQSSAQVDEPLPTKSGAEPSPYWNALGPLIALPQKVPLIQLTDRPVQLETPRQYFLTPRTPNAAFFVRWHLAMHPRSIDLSAWRLRVEGHVEHVQSLSFEELLRGFRPATVVAVNQCAGNSRSRFAPRVPGSQWGNGGMGCAEWTGVKLRDLLGRARVRRGALFVQFEGLDKGAGPPGLGSAQFLKSLDLGGDGIDEAILAYAMNGEPLPLLNGFPLRLVVPGYFGTYWVKSLGTVRVLSEPDQNFWMKTAYRAPATPDGSTTPEAMARGEVKLAPLGRMPVRSFIVTPDGSTKLPEGLPVIVRGLAFSGYDRITAVEVSTDDGKTWSAAQLGENLGPHAFRPWSFRFVPTLSRTDAGRVALRVRATDGKGNRQSDDLKWNSGGYLWNRIERQEVYVGKSG